jgi:hypothetical protein
VEFARRFLLIICTFTAILMLNVQTPVLILLEQADFEQDLRIAPYPWRYKGKTVEEYAEEKTRGLITVLPDKDWQKLLKLLQEYPDGYLKVNAMAASGVMEQLNLDIPERYIKGKNSSQGEFLRVRRLMPDNYSYRYAPYLYRHPCSGCSPLVLLLGLLLYLLLPGHKFDENTLSYSNGFSAVYGVDLVAWMITAGFFTLGLGVGLSGTDGGVMTLFSSNLIAVSGVLWLFMLFGFYMFRIAAGYAGTGLQCRDKQLIRYAPAGKQVRQVRSIKSVRLGCWKASKWLTRLGFLVSLFSWRVQGPTLLNSSRSDPQLEIYFKDGKSWVFTLTGAKNIRPVLQCLEENAVEIPSSLKNA